MSSLTTTSVQHAACPQVIVSLATFGERAFLIKDVVRSLTQTQSIQPDMVVVHVTEASAQLTTFVKKEFNCTLGIPCGRLLIMPGPDYGPATKLLGTLRLFPQLPPDACIITVDDDTIYGQHLVRTLTSRALDNAALGLSCEEVPWALNFVRSYIYSEALWWTPISSGNAWAYPLRQALVQCNGWLHGCQGVLYRRKFFAEDVWDDTQGVPRGCFYADDVRLSGYLWSKGIPRYVYPHYFAEDGWSQPYQHMAKNASNALSMVPDTMRTRQWPCVQHFEQLHA